MIEKVKQFFDDNDLVTASKLPKERRRFTYWDMIAFAALFAKEQQNKSLKELREYTLDLYTGRDHFSGAKLLELVRDKTEELFGGALGLQCRMLRI